MKISAWIRNGEDLARLGPEPGGQQPLQSGLVEVEVGERQGGVLQRRRDDERNLRGFGRRDRVEGMVRQVMAVEDGAEGAAWAGAGELDLGGQQIVRMDQVVYQPTNEGIR